MRFMIRIAALFLVAIPLSAQTADEIIAKYVKTIGGADKLESIHSLRKTGKFNGGGGFEAVVVQENKRPDKVREEFSLQGMTGVNAYDGRSGWKIEPWQGKKDPESLGEDELKEITEDADFDGPLVDYAKKGNKVEYLGTEPVEGTDAYKLKVTRANGDIEIYYMDSEYYVPIKIETTRFVRGAERQSETVLGDYKQVNGVYLPFSFESGPKGSQEQDRSKVTFSSIQANVPIADARFVRPSTAGETKEQREGQPVDASTMQPKNQDEKKSEGTPAKPAENPPAKPPVSEKGTR